MKEQPEELPASMEVDLTSANDDSKDSSARVFMTNSSQGLL